MKENTRSFLELDIAEGQTNYEDMKGKRKYTDLYKHCGCISYRSMMCSFQCDLHQETYIERYPLQKDAYATE